MVREEMIILLLQFNLKLTKRITIYVSIFFCIAISVEGLREDRCVARENSSFEIHCNHKLENVTRIRWEYISATDNKSESIYDSQYKEILKIGFEISCEPQQTLIRTCILKLIKARKEDSGKYICYVGMEGEANIDSNLVERIIEITELVVKGPIRKTMVVNVGDSVILQCEHNVKNLTRARWSHVSMKGVENYQLYYVDWKEAFNSNYEGLCKSHEPSCNLKILEANKESAGKYICMVGESQEFEEKYGLFELTYFIEIQLVVGDMICNDDMTKDLTLIGENDCYGIEADVLNLKCSFNYFGNINYNLLHLRWIEKYKFNSLEKKLNSSLINHEVKDETKKISIQTNLSVACEMQNSIFQCILDDTLVKPCQLHGFKIQYIKSTTERSPPIYLNDLHNIKCSVKKKSENVHCSYYWVHEVGGAMVQNPYAILPVENMNSPGNYTCIAKCHLGKSKKCIIRAMEFEVFNSHQSGVITALIVIIITLAMPYFLIFCCLLKRYLNVRRGCGRIFLKRMKISHHIIEYAESSNFGPSRAKSNIEQDNLKQNQSQDKDNAYDFPSNSFYSSRLTKSNETNEKSFFSLEVKRILVKMITNHDDIIIYESNNPLHGKVLMLDGALWDTNYEGPSPFEYVAIRLLECHPKPKKVLMVGRCEGRIVQKLLNCSDIESISLYDIDEAGSGQAEGLHKLYREHFSNVVSCLKDAKIHKLSGDLDFLENRKYSFDVIVTHSSSSCKSPYKHLLSNKYFQSVKSALGKGGIAVIIVSGQDAMESFVENELQSLCKKLFEMVKYFKFPTIPQFNHPSCLTRCLVCALKPEKGFGEGCDDAFRYLCPAETKNEVAKLPSSEPWDYVT